MEPVAEGRIITLQQVRWNDPIAEGSASVPGESQVPAIWRIGASRHSPTTLPWTPVLLLAGELGGPKNAKCNELGTALSAGQVFPILCYLILCMFRLALVDDKTLPKPSSRLPSRRESQNKGLPRHPLRPPMNLTRALHDVSIDIAATESSGLDLCPCLVCQVPVNSRTRLPQHDGALKTIQMREDPCAGNLSVGFALDHEC